ncbi:Uncharacterized protein APZ42_002318, partial [Daphnia magna]
IGWLITNPAQPRVTGGDAAIVPRDVALTNGLDIFAEQLFPNVTAYVNMKIRSSLSFRDYGTSGNTKLFIAQYRMLNDTAGVSPEVELKAPAQGDVVVERQNVLLSATANDDVA